MARKYTIGDTVYFPFIHQYYNLSTNTHTDTDVDANYPKITIFDPEGTKKVDSQTITPVDTGKYEYQYEIPSDAESGLWIGYIDIKKNNLPEREHFSFEVI